MWKGQKPGFVPQPGAVTGILMLIPPKALQTVSCDPERMKVFPDTLNL